MPPLFIYTRALYHWGFSVRIPGTSGGGPSLPIPPPTTLIGALAYGIINRGPEVLVLDRGKRRKRSTNTISVASPAIRIAKHVLAVGARITPRKGLAFTIPSYDKMRYQITPYQGQDNLKDINQWFASLSFGVTYSPNIEIEFIVILDEKISNNLGVNEKILLRAALMPPRLGSKESLITVLDVKVGEASETQGGETTLYAPIEAIEDDEECTSRVEAWHPWDEVAWGRPEKPRLPKRLDLCVPGAFVMPPNVFVFPRREFLEPIELREDWPTYEGSWSEDLGVVASLPRLEVK